MRPRICRGGRVQFPFRTVEYHITQYELEQGALEIQYIEEYFGEFPRKKTAAEIVRRLNGRAHLILLASAPLPDDPGIGGSGVLQGRARNHARTRVEPKLDDLVNRLRDYVQFDGRRVLYTWIGGTRRDWRGQGHFRALTEQQEAWAIEQGFDEIVVKTKNKFYEMRGTLDHLRFEVVKYERNAGDNAESKVYLSKKLLPGRDSTPTAARKPSSRSRCEVRNRLPPPPTPPTSAIAIRSIAIRDTVERVRCDAA